MDYRPLGKTGLMVSSLAVGTVSLGVDYGIQVPGDFGRPDEGTVRDLLHAAADAGVNLFDTAPGYGEAEARLGRALGTRRDSLFATKVTVPRDDVGRPLKGDAMSAHVIRSVEQSLRRLRREAVDVLQVHNATEGVLADGGMLELLGRLRAQGKARFVGVSVYTEAEALAAVQSGAVHLVQAAYNLLDQRLAARVLPAAEAAGVAVMTRSVLLKGVLSNKARHLPAPLEPLQQAATRACMAMGGDWNDLPAQALRFCLSEPRVATVLIGPRTPAELDTALAAAARGPLAPDVLQRAPALAVDDAELLNPATWPAVA